jgi:hypothetical protein
MPVHVANWSVAMHIDFDNAELSMGASYVLVNGR